MFGPNFETSSGLTLRPARRDEGIRRRRPPTQVYNLEDQLFLQLICDYERHWHRCRCYSPLNFARSLCIPSDDSVPLPLSSQYDIYSSTYSPDGRIFQIEYANKAVENSGYVPVTDRQWTEFHKVHCSLCEIAMRINVPDDSICRTAIGLRVKGGVVLAVEKLVQSKLVIPGSNKRIQSADIHIGIVSCLLYLLHSLCVTLTHSPRLGICWIGS